LKKGSGTVLIYAYCLEARISPIKDLFTDVYDKLTPNLEE